ncbi:MAG TPA: UDP-N-acetylmuramate dehydrogenase [Chitinophagaceae bacterium]|nr:UDP-N-acetylmuramate dehydrogenase [Chitinophagaceae bacterium]
MNFKVDYSLLPFNTFHIDSKAKYFISVQHENELTDVLKSPIALENELYILGGGSNILLTKNIEGYVIHNEMKGIQIIYEDDEKAQVKFMAGENWHHCVCWCVDRQLGGIENLSLIPGTIGASPIQNIGAYGVELKDVFHSLEAIEIKSGNKKTFTHTECEFGYRNSLFKNKEKGKFIIISVTLELRKKPVFNISYGNIQQELDAMGVKELSIQAISNAVIRIRKSKLPDPKVIGNAGSFFKNPTISLNEYEELISTFPDLPSYKSELGVKIPAAWLIEHTNSPNGSSWKGYREHNFGVHAKQALCLVNYDDAKGKQIFDLSKQIITSVQRRFNILLEREVNIW